MAPRFFVDRRAGVTGGSVRHVIAFHCLLLGCCTYALRHGGAPERWAATLEIVAVALTTFVQAVFRSHRYYVDFSGGLFLIDGLLLIALSAIALISDRFWPMPAAGFQEADIVVHLCKLIAPDFQPLGYGFGIAFWGYPKLVLLAVGARRHQRRLTRQGKDPCWSRPRGSDNALISARSG